MPALPILAVFVFTAQYMGKDTDVLFATRYSMKHAGIILSWLRRLVDGKNSGFPVVCIKLRRKRIVWEGNLR